MITGDKVVVGVDPGPRHSGASLLVGREVVSVAYLDAKTLNIDAKSIWERAHLASTELFKLLLRPGGAAWIDTQCLVILGIESAAFSMNYCNQTEQLACMRQACFHAMCEHHHIALTIECSPQSGKRALTGRGNASKADMVVMAKSQYPNLFASLGSCAAKKRETIADSLGVALFSSRKII